MKLLRKLFVQCTHYALSTDLRQKLLCLQRAAAEYNVSIADIAGSQERWDTLVQQNENYIQRNISTWVRLALPDDVDDTDRDIAEFIKNQTCTLVPVEEQQLATQEM